MAKLTPTGASDLDIGRQLMSGLIETTAELEQSPVEETENVEPEAPIGESEPRVFTVKQGDREIDLQLLSDDVDPESVRLGLLADADYRKKTMALAEQRKAAAAQLQDLESKLEDAKGILETDIQSLEDSDLKESDPEEYLRQFDALNSRVAKYKAAAETAQNAQAEQARLRKEREDEALSNSLPSWLDETIRETEIQKIGAQLRAIGFSDDEIGGINDHRVMLMARKAALFDELQDVSDKRDRTPPKSLRPGVRPTKGQVEESQIADLRKQVREGGGKLKDVAALFKTQLIKD